MADEHIGILLKRVREAQGLSKYKVEKITGFNHANLYRIESGNELPSHYMLKALCDFYSVNSDAYAAILARAKQRHEEENSIKRLERYANRSMQYQSPT